MPYCGLSGQIPSRPGRRPASCRCAWRAAPRGRPSLGALSRSSRRTGAAVLEMTEAKLWVVAEVSGEAIAVAAIAPVPSPTTQNRVHFAGEEGGY